MKSSDINEFYHRRFNLSGLWAEDESSREVYAAIFGKWVREYWDELKTLSGIHDRMDGADRYVQKLVLEGRHNYLARMAEALKWVGRAEAVEDLSVLSDKALVLWMFNEGYRGRQILLDRCLEVRPGFNRKNFASYAKQLRLSDHLRD
tara:strand:- start:185 stop:628 length:444 start_codon:yes stop_codon:yes gene_type:complete